MDFETLNNLLTSNDRKIINDVKKIYTHCENGLLSLQDCYDKIGKYLFDVLKDEPNIKIVGFDSERSLHGEISRITSKLRNKQTNKAEFIYYTQQAYQHLFNFAYNNLTTSKRRYTFVENRMNVQAVHKVPDIDEYTNNAAMIVLLRGALLPSIIYSKENQDFSSTNYITPFALLKINRNETKKENNMEYILNEKLSYFNPSEIDGKDLIFCDGMLATGGSIISAIEYFKKIGIKPKSVKIFSIFGVYKGIIRCIRGIENCSVYSFWIDPVLNDDAYILPGVGDYGDILNGKDSKSNPRNLIQLLMDYGTNIIDLYRSQIRQIEKTILLK